MFKASKIVPRLGNSLDVDYLLYKSKGRVAVRRSRSDGEGRGTMGSEAGLDVLREQTVWVRWVILSDEISPQVYCCLALAGHEIPRACESLEV
jgi:hypothetical protein